MAKAQSSYQKQCWVKKIAHKSDLAILEVNSDKYLAKAQSSYQKQCWVKKIAHKSDLAILEVNSDKYLGDMSSFLLF